MKALLDRVYSSPATFFVALGTVCALVIFLVAELLTGGHL